MAWTVPLLLLAYYSTTVLLADSFHYCIIIGHFKFEYYSIMPLTYALQYTGSSEKVLGDVVASPQKNNSLNSTIDKTIINRRALL